jgi:hypothetical protein
MRLANGLAAFEFDPQTGSLIGIADLRTGMSFLSNPAQGRLFHLFVPDRENWIDRYADNHTAGKPEIALSGDTLTIRYTNVVAADGSPLVLCHRIAYLPAGLRRNL